VTEPKPSAFDSLRPILRYVPFAAACVLLVLAFVLGSWSSRKFARATPNVAAQKMASYTQCLIVAKRAAIARASNASAEATNTLPPAYATMLRAFAAQETCAQRTGVPFFSSGDVYDITGVHWWDSASHSGPPAPTDAVWRNPDVPRKANCDPSGLTRASARKPVPCTTPAP